MRILFLLALLLISGRAVAQEGAVEDAPSARQVCDAWREHIVGSEEQRAYDEHCSTNPPPTSVPAQTPVVELATVIYWVQNLATIRDEPSTVGGNTTVIRTAALGEQLNVVGETAGEIPAGWQDNDLWFIIELDDGTTGYVYSALVAPYPPTGSTSSPATSSGCGPQRAGLCLRPLQRQHCSAYNYKNWFIHWEGDDHGVWLCRSDDLAIQFQLATGLISQRKRPLCGTAFTLPCAIYYPFNAPTFAGEG